MAWRGSNPTLRHTHTSQIHYQTQAREKSTVCPEGILLRCTALFKRLIYSDSVVGSTEGHHWPMLGKHPGQYNHTSQMPRFP